MLTLADGTIVNKNYQDADDAMLATDMAAAAKKATATNLRSGLSSAKVDKRGINREM